MTACTVLTICSTCRPTDSDPASTPEGAALGAAARRVLAGSSVETRSIACLSNCSRGCSATVAAPGKFSYVIGSLTAADAQDLATFALKHAESADGVPAWRDRPERIRKNTIARIPPPDRDHPLVTAVEG